MPKSTIEELASLPQNNGLLQELLSPLVLLSNIGKVGGSNIATGVRNALGGNGDYAVPSSLSELAGLSPGSGITSMSTGNKLPGSTTFEGLMLDAAQNRGADYSQFMQNNPGSHLAMEILADPLGVIGGVGGIAKGRALARLAETALSKSTPTLADKVARAVLYGSNDLPVAGKGISGATDPIRRAVGSEDGLLGTLNEFVTFTPGTRSYFSGKSLIDKVNPWAKPFNEDLYLYGKGALQAPTYSPLNRDATYDRSDEILERFSQMPGVLRVRRLSPDVWEAEMRDGTKRTGLFREKQMLSEGDEIDRAYAAKHGDHAIRGYMGPDGNLFTGDALDTTPRHEYLHTLQQTGRFTPEEIEGLRNEWRRSGGTGDEDDFQEWVAQQFEKHQAGQGSGVMSRVSELAKSLYSNQGLPTMRRTFGRVMEGDVAGRTADGLEGLARQHSVQAYQGGPTAHTGHDDKYLGSGEGGAFFGHGHYFSDDLGVAKQYRDTLGGDKGSLYSAELGGKVTKWADWYEPVKEDDALAFFDALERKFGIVEPDIEFSYTEKSGRGRYTWQDLYRGAENALERRGGAPSGQRADAAISDMMNEMGYTGIRYPTGTVGGSKWRKSGAAPERNYVVFKAQDINTKGRATKGGRDYSEEELLFVEQYEHPDQWERMGYGDDDVEGFNYEDIADMVSPAAAHQIMGIARTKRIPPWKAVAEWLDAQTNVFTESRLPGAVGSYTKLRSRQYSLGPRSIRDRAEIQRRIDDKQIMTDLDRLRVKLQLRNRIEEGMSKVAAQGEPGPAARAEGEYRAALTAHRGIREVVDENAQGVLVDRIAGSAIYDPLTGRTTVHPALTEKRAADAVRRGRQIQRDMSWRDHKVELPDESGTMHEVVAGKLARDLTNRVVTLKRLQECLAS